MAAAFQPQPDPALLGDAQELDAAAVGGEIWLHLVQRLLDSRFQAEGVKAMQEQQAADHLVPPQPLDERLARLARLVEDLQDPLQPLAVQAEERLDRLRGDPAPALVREGVQVADQRLGPEDLALELLLLQGPPPSTGRLGLSGSIGFLDSGSIPVV